MIVLFHLPRGQGQMGAIPQPGCRLGGHSEVAHREQVVLISNSDIVQVDHHVESHVDEAVIIDLPLVLIVQPGLAHVDRPP